MVVRQPSDGGNAGALLLVLSSARDHPVEDMHNSLIVHPCNNPGGAPNTRTGYDSGRASPGFMNDFSPDYNPLEALLASMIGQTGGSGGEAMAIPLSVHIGPGIAYCLCTALHLCAKAWCPSSPCSFFLLAWNTHTCAKHIP